MQDSNGGRSIFNNSEANKRPSGIRASSSPIILVETVLNTLKIKNGKSDVPFYSFYGKESNGQLTWIKNSQQKFVSKELEKVKADKIQEEYEGESEYKANNNFIQGVYSSSLTYELENYIVGEFSGLGWINCDRFYDTNEKITMKFSIDGGDSETPYSVYLIFKDINSVLPIYKVTNGTYQTPKIPKGAKATLLAVKVIDKSENKLAFQDITIDENTVINLKSTVIKKANLDGYMRDIIF